MRYEGNDRTDQTVQRRQRLWSSGCGDERLRSLTSCTSCWDIGSYQNPVRKRRAQFLLAQILLSWSFFPLHVPTNENKCFIVKHYCMFWYVHCAIIKQGKQHDSSPTILIYNKLCLNHRELHKNNTESVLSLFSLCTDIFHCCCVNSSGHTVDDVASANAFSAGWMTFPLAACERGIESWLRSCKLGWKIQNTSRAQKK